MTSLLGKQWHILDETTRPIAEKLNRGLNDHELHFHDPFLFSDMERAVNRIIQAIERNERIIIFGDYDVDGISSCALLYHALKKCGATVSYRLPNRVTDGYGLSEKFIDEFIAKQIGLIITVDCGIACFHQIAKANAAGIDTIITDHHSVPAQIPEAYAIIHPLHCKNYPFKGLTGAGVAYKLAEALAVKLLPPDQKITLLNRCLELACLGTVADLGPLRDENRLIVKEGLKVLSQTRTGGLGRLKQLAGIADQEITAAHIGFKLAPRINAAGRIGDPYRALALLLDEVTPEKITAAADYLEQTNEKRRELTHKAELEIIALLNLTQPPSIVIEQSADWHPGILGLIAGRLAEKTNRPVIAFQDLGDTLTASARAPEGLNIIALLRECHDLLIAYGGHEQAAGLSVSKSNLPAFKAKITALTDELFLQNPPQAKLFIDAEIAAHELTPQLLQTIKPLAPFGQANEEPIFLIKNLPVQNLQTIGQNRDHLKFQGHNLSIIGFGFGPHFEKLQNAATIDLVFKLLENNFRGRTTMELQAIDLKTLT